MRRALLLPSLISVAILVCSAGTALGQTYYYIDAISVTPPAPTTSDDISITLAGNLSSSGAYIVSATHMLMGNTVHITVIAADPGGLAVLVPHDETLDIGPLAAGTYTILVDGNAVLDMAPAPQHEFVVTEGGSPCDHLEIASVRWHAFTDTAIVVHAMNTNMIGELFDYPNFILFDMSGDTLAKETVNFFGIGEDSWHVLRVMDGVTIPSGSFPTVLELWTGFTTTLACSWELPVDLCPPAPCATLIPWVQNFGGALTIGSYPWSIYDEALTLIASGTFTMVDTVQFDSDTLCVPPGHYFMECGPNDPPTGGQPYFGVQTEGWISGPSTPLVWSLPVPLEFDFYEPCFEGTNALAEMPSINGLSVLQENGMITIGRRDGSMLGPVAVFDVEGRSLYHGSSSSNTAVVDLSDITSGVVVIRAGDVVFRMVLLTR
ncbi:MAG: hypothetical protein ABI432_04295 [Flavobacteriales bacterium]